MQKLVHPQAFTHTKRLQRMLRGAENCYSMLVAMLPASGLQREGLFGHDAATLADLQAANEAVTRQRSLEDEPESASDSDAAALPRGVGVTTSPSLRDADSDSPGDLPPEVQSVCRQVKESSAIARNADHCASSSTLTRKRRRQPDSAEVP